MSSQPILLPSAQRIPNQYAATELEFNLADEIVALQLEPAYASGRNSKTLVKHADFRIVLTALRGGTHIHEHRATGRISVQCVSGEIRMHLPDRTVDLAAGRLLALDRGVAHDVEALRDSAFLLTIAWPE